MRKTDPVALARALTPYERECLLFALDFPLGDAHGWTEAEILETCERALAHPHFQHRLADDEILAKAKRRMMN